MLHIYVHQVIRRIQRLQLGSLDNGSPLFPFLYSISLYTYIGGHTSAFTRGVQLAEYVVSLLLSIIA